MAESQFSRKSPAAGDLRRDRQVDACHGRDLTRRKRIVLLPPGSWFDGTRSDVSAIGPGFNDDGALVRVSGVLQQVEIRVKPHYSFAEALGRSAAFGCIQVEDGTTIDGVDAPMAASACGSGIPSVRTGISKHNGSVSQDNDPPAGSLITGKALERYFELNAALREFSQLFRDERNERAAAIIGASFLDTLLEHCLTNFLVDDDKEVRRLLEYDQPIGTFGGQGISRLLPRSHWQNHPRRSTAGCQNQKPIRT